ncbi:PadR family transcriptional regulator, partial [Streptomyces sp. NPDC059762]
DPIALINRQRRQHLNTMRSLSRLAAGEDRDNNIAQLLIEGAMLHLQADLDWLERCQEELE